jgi:hypothetical protein
VGSLVSALFLWLGYLWIAVDWRKQGWHDKIAATLVVRAIDESDERAEPGAAVHPPPAPRPAAQDSADAQTFIPPPLPAAFGPIEDRNEGASAAP